MKIILENQYGTKKVRVKTDGWSWEAFLLGVIWYCVKGMWGKGLGYSLLCFCLSWTIVVPVGMWIYMGVKFNEQYYDHLLDEGYHPVK